jgi:hypothetical protein
MSTHVDPSENLHPYDGENLAYDNGSRRCRKCRSQHYRRVYLRRKAEGRA